MKITKRTVAREWLLFLGLFCLGCPCSFFIGYVTWTNYYLHFSRYRDFDDFWNHRYGLGHLSWAATWLVPYLTVMLVRSVWWSLKMLRGKSD
jgi:hypothetical protein